MTIFRHDLHQLDPKSSRVALTTAQEIPDVNQPLAKHAEARFGGDEKPGLAREVLRNRYQCGLREPVVRHGVAREERLLIGLLRGGWSIRRSDPPLQPIVQRVVVREIARFAAQDIMVA